MEEEGYEGQRYKDLWGSRKRYKGRERPQEAPLPEAQGWRERATSKEMRVLRRKIGVVLTSRAALHQHLLL